MISTLVYYVAPEDLTEEDGSKTITGSKMFPHKKDFDSLSYEGKLNFWKANKADPDCWHYAVRKPKTEKPVKFSIIPDSNTEKELYIEWRTQLIKDMFKNTKHHEDWLKVWDCDKIKEDFYLITANKKNKIEIIEACKLQITKHKEQLNISSVKLGYDYYNSTTKREYFYTIFEKTYFNFEDFLKGINCAELIAFYKNEIKCLESKEISSPQQNKSLPETDIEEAPEPKNPHKRIFVNGFAYDFFERLRGEIINNPNFSYADYSFIIPKMITDNYLIETNHLKLIRFLDKHYQTKIEKKYFQFKTSEAENKKLIYKRLNKEYKSKINSIL